MSYRIPLRGSDIRGAYPEEFDTYGARAAAYGFAQTLRARRVGVATDTRGTSTDLAQAVLQGLYDGGARVIRLGSGTTELLTYMVGAHLFDGGIFVGAGHAPEGHNGLRMIGADCDPLSPSAMGTVLEIAQGYTIPETANPLKLDYANPRTDLVEFFGRVLEPYGNWPVTPGRKFVVILDGGPGVAASLFLQLAKRLKLPSEIVFHQLGDVAKAYPDHDPDAPRRREEMGTAIRALDADLGLSWSGDGARLRAYTSKGTAVHGAYLGAYIGLAVGKRYGAQPLCSDLRVMYPMTSVATDAGATYVTTPPGSALMKNALRQTMATFGAESSGRYYFREFWWSESGQIAAMLALHLAYLLPTPLEEVVANFSKQFPIYGEITVPTADVEGAMWVAQTALEAVAHLSWLENGFVATPTRPDLPAGPDHWRAVVRRAQTEKAVRFTVEGFGNPRRVREVGTALRAVFASLNQETADAQ